MATATIKLVNGIEVPAPFKPKVVAALKNIFQIAPTSG